MSRRITVPARDVRVTAEADVVVAGGGPAGICAAVAAARTGARTVLLERAPFLGGTATGAMVASFMGFFWRDRRVAGGVGYEVTQRLIEAGGATGFTRYLLAEASENPIEVRTFPFDPEVLKSVLDEMATEAGVDVLLHTQATEAILTDGRVTGVLAQGLFKPEAFGAGVVIDATGNAVIARTAGCRAENAGDDPAGWQPMTMMARLADVDVPRFRALPRERKRRLARQGMATGELPQQLLSLVSSPSGDDAFILMTRVSGFDGSDTRDLAQAEMEGRRQLRGVVPFLRREVPGFERAHVVAVAPWIGVRETWRIIGDSRLEEADVLEGRQSAEAIAQGGGPLDVHHRDGGGLSLIEPAAPFSVPYRCLVPRDVDGLTVAGRCVSATRTAMGAVRHMGTVMAIGHAAGAAGALAARERIRPRDVRVSELRDLLRSQGAVVDSPLSHAG
ncbi:FAD-dependent oxidoreductase [Actinoallomurus iriomotensis]|uniref:Membrane protein n=1 Tax=Actinoallomurus iriomotensis TaxID=478107 RepID=A0A9W6SG78_9ACTN|nr:FAD-dependent oxidoreductase [Actinoallomurus iriomotensis]GLY92305.1 membrane protein [Actinoallomurus iriomotensis]